VIPSQGGFRIDTRPSNQGQSVTIQDTAARYAPYVLSIVRIVAALLFFEHGTSRLFGWPSPLPTPAPLSMYWFAGAIELVGGALLVLGLFTRPAALIMSGEMAFAYFISHAPAGFFPILNRGDAAILYCFIFLYIAFAGGGPWSVDALMGRKFQSAVSLPFCAQARCIEG
jgi:putative oxidoreductase